MKEFLDRLKKAMFILLSKGTGLFINNKGSDIILFGARNGEFYMDNSRALFEWFTAHRQKGRYYWMTKNIEIYDLLNKNNLPVARIDSFKGVWLLHKAKYACYTNRLRDIAIDYRAVPSSLKMIFLSHGQSVKNTRLAVNDGVDDGYKNDTLKASAQMAFAISTSPFMAEVQSKSNGLQPVMYKNTGFPRNDWMFNLPDFAVKDWQKFVMGKTYSKVILYAPTWRRNDKTKMFPFEDFNALELANFVSDNNLLLLLRPHLQDLKDNEYCESVATKLIALSENIRLATIDHFVDANFLLPYVDALISDYSSIYHDFLLLDRPIYFVPYDLNTFDQVNGFKYPYKENLPGPIIDTQKQLLHEFLLFVKNVDLHKVKREKLKNLIYIDFDGKSCERIAGEI